MCRVVGINLKELTLFSGTRHLTTSIIINFLITPLVAYVLGITLLKEHLLMFVGLALSALLHTSGTTISWTILQSGNVGGARKLTMIGLIPGSILTPWYLLAMVEQFVEINVFLTIRTILVVLSLCF